MGFLAAKSRGVHYRKFAHRIYELPIPASRDGLEYDSCGRSNKVTLVPVPKLKPIARTIKYERVYTVG